MDVKAIVGGTTYYLTMGDLAEVGTELGEDLRLVAFDNLGMSPNHRLSSRGPQQHGESDEGFRLDPRYFSLVWEMVGGGTRGALFTLRRRLLGILRPMESPTVLEFVLDNGDVRRIDAYVQDAPMGHNAGERYDSLRVGVQFKAPDPTFYAASDVNVVFSLGGGSAALEVPLTVPMNVGVSTLDQVRTIAYAGSWYAFPIVKIVGPITDAVVTNELTGEKLDFTGTTIAADDYYEIDTRYGQKTVVDSSGANKIGALADDHDLSTFHLEPPEGEDSVRNNSIRVEGESVTAATEVYVRYRTRYVGI